MADVTVEKQLVFGVFVVGKIVRLVRIGDSGQCRPEAHPVLKPIGAICVVYRSRELEVEVHVIPHADNHYTFPLLRHSIVRRIEKVVLHPVAESTEILENHLEHSALAEVHQSLHVLRKEG